MKSNDAKMSRKAKIIWILILIGFLCMEFPGVFFFKDKSEPYIFGFPFIYAFNLIMWGYMIIVILVAYLLNWGEPKPKNKEDKGGDSV